MTWIYKRESCITSCYLKSDVTSRELFRYKFCRLTTEDMIKRAHSRFGEFKGTCLEKFFSNVPRKLRSRERLVRSKSGATCVRSREAIHASYGKELRNGSFV